jgi:MoxR-like ATPase
MQEKQVTIGETTFPLDRPFLVMATQNPVEQEGTYPLPEAQMDRFMMKVYIDYPTKDEELEVMRRMSDIGFQGVVNPVLDTKMAAEISKDINEVAISEILEKYIIELVFASRKPADYGLKDEGHYIQFGASPRATISLHRAARAIAYFNERDFVLPEDIKEVAPDVLNHRIILNYEAEADGVNSRQIVDRILAKVAIGK